MEPWDEVALTGRRRWCVVQQDCREVLPRLWPGTVRLMLTDPPYGLSAEEEGEEKGKPEITRNGDSAPLVRDFGPWDRRPLDELATLIRGTLGAAALPLHENGAAYVFSSDLLFEATRRALVEKLQCLAPSFGAWCKTNPAPSVRQAGPLSAMELFLFGRRPGNPYNFPGHRCAYNWMEAPVPHYLHRRHPCEKPVQLLERLIRASSSPGDVVVDPFCGGGATGEAALRTGRRFIGIEIDPVHAGRAVQRLEKLSPTFTGEPASLAAAAPP